MPPKGWRKTAVGFQPTNSAGDNIKDRVVHGIDDLLLPRTVVAGIAKQALPEGMPLPKDGVTALMRSATMFTSYITAEANSIARNESRKTINQNDIHKALEKCDFASFVNPTVELADLRQQQRTKKTSNDAETAEEVEEDQIEEDSESESPSGGPTAESKRQRVEEESLETTPAPGDMDVEE